MRCIIKSIFKSVVIITIFSVLTKMVGFLFRVYLSRTLSTYTLGIYTLAYSVFTVLVTAVSSGTPLAISKLVSSSNNNKSCGSYVFNALWISSILSVAICIFVLVFPKLFYLILTTKESFTLLLSMLPAVISNAMYAPFRGYLWGKEQYFKVSFVELVEQIIKITTCFTLFTIFNKLSKILSVGIAVSLSCILSSIVGVVFYFTSSGRLHRNRALIKPVIHSATPLTLVRLSGSLTQPLMSLILTHQLVHIGFSNDQALSQIGVAMGLTMPVLSIPGTLIGSLAMALIPRISKDLNDKNYSSISNQISASYTFTISSLCFACLIFYTFGDKICMLLYNNLQSGIILQNTAWVMLPMGISQLTTSILNSLSLEQKTFKFYIISSLILLTCVYFMPQFVGVYALLISMGVSMTIISVLNIHTIKTSIPIKSKFFTPLLTQLAVCLPLSLLLRFMYNLLNIIFTKMFAFVLCSMLGFVIYVALLFALNVLDIVQIAPLINKYKKKRTSKV